MTVEWVFWNGTLEVWIDGELLLTAVDPAPPGAGRFGIGADLFSPDGRLLLDNVVVCELTGPFELIIGEN